MNYIMKAFDPDPGSIHAPIELVNVKHLLYITLQPMKQKDNHTKSATFGVHVINPKQIPLNPKEHGYKRDLFSSVEFDMADSATTICNGTVTITNGHITYKFYRYINFLTNKKYIPKNYKNVESLLNTYYQTDYYKEPEEIARDKRYWYSKMTKSDKKYYKKHFGVTHGFTRTCHTDTSDVQDLPF